MEPRMLLSAILTSLALLSLLCSTPTALKIQVYKDNEVLRSYSRPTAEFNGQSYDVPRNGILGILVYPHPKNACQSVQPAPDLNDNNTHVFAYIDEYSSCPGYIEGNLEDAQYDAMIAYSKYYKFTTLADSANIPRALVDNSEFATYLKNNAITNDTSDLNPNTTVYVFIQNDSLDLEMLFIVFGMILLSALLISISIFCCSVCWRVLVVKWRNRGLTRWQVRRLPKRKWRRARDGACETCSICLEEFKEGESVRVLPCDHVFHPKCVDVWLQKWNRTCPLCKSAIKRQGKPLFTEDLESSRLITDSGAPSQEGDDERDSPGGSAHGATRGASNYGAMEHTSPLRSMASERHRRNASSTSSSSQRSASRHTRTGSRHDTTVTTTIELNVTSSGETSRSASHSPSPTSSQLPFHTPHESDDDEGDGDISETTPSFKTANGENSVASSVHA